ncbi:DsbA family protein [Martelella mediterranea]|uniref:DsbA family protein n=1 Tax=Martelella mediterranea TaxID=293089 RepID=UPI001E4B6C2F|nr:DsbA family protein [Martelella mediterranea]
MNSRFPSRRRFGFLLLPVLLIVAAGTWYLLDPGFKGHQQTMASSETLPQDAFERRVRDYLVANPEVIVEAMQNLERKQRVAEQTGAQSALSTHRDELLNSPESPVGGNPQGDVTLVEFFDYNCPYCRQVAPAMVAAEDGDPQLRIVYKEFPILGPNSMFAAKAALASHRQNLYPQFHKAMMQASGAADEAQVVAVAEEIGLDVEQLRADMQDHAIDAEIERNLALARALRINGTPGFVIGDEILRGATDLQTMQRLIDQARKDQNR